LFVGHRAVNYSRLDPDLVKSVRESLSGLHGRSEQESLTVACVSLVGLGYDLLRSRIEKEIRERRIRVVSARDLRLIERHSIDCNHASLNVHKILRDHVENIASVDDF